MAFSISKPVFFASKVWIFPGSGVILITTHYIFNRRTANDGLSGLTLALVPEKTIAAARTDGTGVKVISILN